MAYLSAHHYSNQRFINKNIFVSWIKWANFFFALLLCSCASTAAKNDSLYLDLDEKTVVHFAGVSLLGNASYIEKSYPIAKQLNSVSTDKPIALLDNSFYKLSQKTINSDIELSYGFADMTDSSAKILTLAIDHESVSHMETELGRIKTTAEVSGQLLLFDFHTMTLAANYPVYIQKNHISDSLASAKASSDHLIRELYIGGQEGGGKTVLTLASEQLNRIVLQDKAERYIQVSDVKLADSVLSRKPANKSELAFRQYIGQQFTAELSRNYRLEVLPFVKGYAIGNKMAGRFSSGKAYNLSLPQPDYALSVAITGLENRPHGDKHMLYASQANFTLTDSLNGELLMDSTFHYAVPAYRKPGSNLNDWAAYVDSIEELLSDTTLMLGAPDKAWIKGHGGNKSDFKTLRQNQWLFKAN